MLMSYTVCILRQITTFSGSKSQSHKNLLLLTVESGSHVSPNLTYEERQLQRLCSDQAGVSDRSRGERSTERLASGQWTYSAGYSLTWMNSAAPQHTQRTSVSASPLIFTLLVHASINAIPNLRWKRVTCDSSPCSLSVFEKQRWPLDRKRNWLEGFFKPMTTKHVLWAP